MTESNIKTKVERWANPVFSRNATWEEYNEISDLIRDQANALKQALEALETCQIKRVSEWEVEDITPTIIKEAIAAIKKVQV
jgi:inorganic pyrophosphatase